MFLKRLSRIRGTITFRLIIWYSAFFILSTSLLFLLAYFLLSSSVREKAVQHRGQSIPIFHRPAAPVRRERCLEFAFWEARQFFRP